MPGASTSSGPTTQATPPLPPGIFQRNGPFADHYGQVDIISSERALRDMWDKVRCSRGEGLQDWEIREDLLAGVSTPGGWQWHRFLMGRHWASSCTRRG